MPRRKATEDQETPRVLMNQDELAKYFNVNRVTVWKWGKVGIPHLRAGNMVRYDLQEVLKWMRQRAMANSRSQRGA